MSFSVNRTISFILLSIFLISCSEDKEEVEEVIDPGAIEIGTYEATITLDSKWEDYYMERLYVLSASDIGETGTSEITYINTDNFSGGLQLLLLGNNEIDVAQKHVFKTSDNCFAFHANIIIDAVDAVYPIGFNYTLKFNGEEVVNKDLTTTKKVEFALRWSNRNGYEEEIKDNFNKL